MLKRTFDLLISFFGLVLLMPCFFILGLLVRIDSRGPVFYRQERVGRARAAFKLLKFRTMYVDADKRGAITVGLRDPRITRLGYYLRKYKLDELPQLFNVLSGDMSLVGPRPELKKFVDLYDEGQLRVLSVRPGLTDFASIEFRNENELLEDKTDPIDYYINEILPAKLALNLKYIEERSIWTDIRIIFNTITSVAKGK